jgi:hypothetical protein
MRRTTLLIATLFLCIACTAPRYQLPQSEQQVRANVVSAEDHYKALYAEFKARQLSKSAMEHVDALYNLWLQTQALLMDAARAGAIGVDKE